MSEDTKSEANYLCTLCKGKFSIEGIRYNSEGKVVCVNCSTQSFKQESPTIREDKESFSANPNPDVVPVICIDCRYKFSIRKNSRVRIACPYCGKKNLIRDDTTADELIKQVSQIKDRY
ncbi:hypothetical protein HYX01_01505 [Candidatus Woesearchaeota archaeon]|nr:hypothetical protein [Candidatus Woesearchaeota archaeon]